MCWRGCGCFKDTLQATGQGICTMQYWCFCSLDLLELSVCAADDHEYCILAAWTIAVDTSTTDWLGFAKIFHTQLYSSKA